MDYRSLYKGDKFESCSMNRSTTELGIAFLAPRMACSWFLIYKNGN